MSELSVTITDRIQLILTVMNQKETSFMKLFLDLPSDD